jgi:hypothetical protein
MARIVWSNAEKEAIFARMVIEFQQRPHRSRKDALRTAQTVLDASRWVVINDQRVFNYKDRIDIAQQRAKIAQQLASRESKSTAEKPVEAPVAILAPPPTPERRETPRGRLAEILELLLDVVAESVAARVNAKIADAPPPELRPKHDPRPVPCATGHPRPGVLIIGLLSGQARTVYAVFSDELDLSFFTPEEAVAAPRLVRAHTVLMTKFISHAVQDKYRKAPELHWCNGGLAACMAILDGIKARVL